VYLARSFAVSSVSVVIVNAVGARSPSGEGLAGATVGGAATVSNNGWRRIRATRRRTLRSPFEHLLQAIPKSLGFFGILRRASVSHINEELRLRWVVHEASRNPAPESIYRTPYIARATPS